MRVAENPYQSPQEVSSEQPSNNTSNDLWRATYWLGAGLAIVGCLAFFTPNLPPLGFLLLALVAMAVVSLASARYRLRAVLSGFIILFLAFGAFSYLRASQARALQMRALRAQMLAAEEAARAAAERAAQKATPGGSEAVAP